MGHRLSKIYTRTGDDGTTGLGDGTRIDKDAARIRAIGAVDELNSTIGALLTCAMPEAIQNMLRETQHRLFDLGGELSIPGHSMITAKHVQAIESALDELNNKLKPLREFIVPGGSEGAAWCHLARSVCRRAERDLITLGREEPVSQHSRQYLNRLSDYLFVAARYTNHEAGIKDVLWQRDA